MPGEAPNAARARRLLSLLPHLRSQGSRPLGELAAIAGVDEQTVAEDLTTLSLCGADERDPMALVAVYVEGDRAVVWGDLPALERPVRLTAAEARALAAALDQVGVAFGTGLGERIAALGGLGEDPERIARTVRSAAAPGGAAHAHLALAACAEAGRTAFITYLAHGESAPSERHVEPWRLFFARGAWYLRALSLDAGTPRTYRLDRVLAVRPGDRSFTVPVDVASAIDPAPDPAGLPRATVRFATDAPDLTERDWPAATFDRVPDGTVVASVPFAGTAWLARKIAARLGSAVVQDPCDVVSAVADVAVRELAGLGGENG